MVSAPLWYSSWVCRLCRGSRFLSQAPACALWACSAKRQWPAPSAANWPVTAGAMALGLLGWLCCCASVAGEMGCSSSAPPSRVWGRVGKKACRFKFCHCRLAWVRGCGCQGCRVACSCACAACAVVFCVCVWRLPVTRKLPSGCASVPVACRLMCRVCSAGLGEAVGVDAALALLVAKAGAAGTGRVALACRCSGMGVCPPSVACRRRRLALLGVLVGVVADAAVAGCHCTELISRRCWAWGWL